MVTDQMLSEVKNLFNKEATVMVEASCTFIHIPSLTLPPGNTPAAMEALVSLNSRGDGYPTRLFLSQQVAGKGQNWSSHSILGRAWYTCSWNYVEFTDSPTNVIAQHLRAFK